MLNAVGKIHRIQERLIASREYIIADGYPARATSELRERAMAFALQMSSIEMIKTSAPIFIDREMLLLVRHAMQSLPLTTKYEFAQLLFPAGLVYAEQPLIHLSGGKSIAVGQWYTNDGYAERSVAYLSWHDIPRAKARRVTRLPLLWPFLVGVMEDGSSLAARDPDSETSAIEDHREFMKFMITLWIMLQQRIAVKEHETRNPVLHRVRRQDAVAPPSTVLVIRLRRPSAPDGSERAASPVDWSHRWMVDGHWRNQYHPSTGAHELAWIAPYIKGPGDKPLVLKERVYTFVR